MPLDAAHLHLVLNHLPVIGAPIVLLVLTIGRASRSSEVVTLGLAMTIGLAVASALVYLTGEPAEELIEHASWFRESLTESHEERAVVALVATVLTGALSVAALAFRRRIKWLPDLVWAGLAASTLLLAWTAWSGGQIRHEEIRPTVVSASQD